MPGISDRFHLVRKRFRRVSRDEPGRLKIMFLEQIQQPRRTYFAGEHPAGDIIRRIFSAVRTKPSRYRVDIDTEGTQYFFWHNEFIFG
jgi:hypothetical protein